MFLGFGKWLGGRTLKVINSIPTLEKKKKNSTFQLLGSGLNKNGPRGSDV